MLRQCQMKKDNSQFQYHSHGVKKDKYNRENAVKCAVERIKINRLMNISNLRAGIISPDQLASTILSDVANRRIHDDDSYEYTTPPSAISPIRKGNGCDIDSMEVTGCGDHRDSDDDSMHGSYNDYSDDFIGSDEHIYLMEKITEAIKLEMHAYDAELADSVAQELEQEELYWQQLAGSNTDEDSTIICPFCSSSYMVLNRFPCSSLSCSCGSNINLATRDGDGSISSIEQLRSVLATTFDLHSRQCNMTPEFKCVDSNSFVSHCQYCQYCVNIA